MDDKVCPFCGAEINKQYAIPQYFCGTEVSTQLQGFTCKDRQIAQLTERLEAWRECWPELEQYLFENPDELQGRVEKLKALGEI